MKRIVYLITDHGCDGRAPKSIVSAFWDERKRDDSYKNHPNKNYYSMEEKIVDVERAYKDIMSRINAIDKLVIATVENKESL